MDTILSTNILFFALSIFLILVTVGFVAIIVYVILVLKNLHRFLTMVREEGQKIISDIEALRAKAKSGGAQFASFILSAVSFLKNRKKSKEK